MRPRIFQTNTLDLPVITVIGIILAGLAGFGRSTRLCRNSLGGSSPVRLIGTGIQHIEADIIKILNPALLSQGRDNKRVSRRSVIPYLHASPYRLLRRLCKNRRKQPHETGNTEAITLVLERCTKGFRHIFPIHLRAQVIYKFIRDIIFLYSMVFTTDCIIKSHPISNFSIRQECVFSFSS